MAISLGVLLSCASVLPDNNETNFPSSADFNAYWYQGKAEISSYKLSQARYGEIREGNAVLVFVTEDFSKSKQVKLDNSVKAGKDATSVLKLNMTKKFNTGIYPYSMMMSVFTPVNLNENANTLKSTTSSQEWCGHTFTQINLKQDRYEVDVKSYFESEGDEIIDLPKTLMEDEIWTRIRIAPETLPTGLIDIIPGALAQRLRHSKFQIEKVQISLTEKDSTMIYRLDYPNQDRTLSIYYKKAFPHVITRWEETYLDGWGANTKKLTTIAVLDEQLFTDYWSKNSNADSYLRQELNLD